MKSNWKKLTECLVLSYPHHIHNHKHFGLKRWSCWTDNWLEDEHLVITRCFHRNHSATLLANLCEFSKTSQSPMKQLYVQYQMKNCSILLFWKVSTKFSSIKYLMLLQMFFDILMSEYLNKTTFSCQIITFMSCKWLYFNIPEIVFTIKNSTKVC